MPISSWNGASADGSVLAFAAAVVLARARLQQAQQLGRMALVSANYALAVWADADDHCSMAEQARALAVELGKRGQFTFFFDFQ